MNQNIGFMVTENMPFNMCGTYELRTDRPLVWLQKFLFFILSKIGAYKIEYNLKRYTIEPSIFMQRIFEQRSELIKTFNMIPNRMYIGAVDYDDLMNCPEIRQLMSILTFNTKYNHKQQVIGLEVHIIPWMSGILLVKEEK